MSPVQAQKLNVTVRSNRTKPGAIACIISMCWLGIELDMDQKAVGMEVSYVLREIEGVGTYDGGKAHVSDCTIEDVHRLP
ncbi:hypothetical protein D3C86_1298910 [compost metagenome]